MKILNSKELLKLIENVLENNNELIQKYKKFGKKILKKPQKIIVIKDYKKINLKIYNKPSENDFAALVSSNPNDLINYKDIIIEHKNSKLKRINHKHAFCDPLFYPLIFWDGKPRWSIKMKLDKKITLRDFLVYHLQTLLIAGFSC